MDEQNTGAEEITEINGYLFRSKADYERALKERDTIEKIKKGIDPDNFEGIKQIYIKLTAKNYFSTPIGLDFLHEMQVYLIENGEEVPMVPVPVSRASKYRQNSNSLTYEEEIESLREENEKAKGIKSKLIIAVVALAFTVIAMFIMVMTNDNLGYYNAEEKVLNKYSAWEEELNSREEQLNEREDALNSVLNSENP